MHSALIYPLIIPFITGLVAYFFRTSKSINWFIGFIGLLALLAANISLLVDVQQHQILVLQPGNVVAPFGISFVADYLSVSMLMLTVVIALASWIFAAQYLNEDYYHTGLTTIFSMLIFGINGAFLTGDIFNLYVWFEVILISSFALFIIRGNPTKLDAAIKYVAINLLATLTFLLAVAMLYGLTGSLNMAELHMSLQKVDQPLIKQTIIVLFIIALGIKAAVFPLFFWLPASYHTLPVPIVAFFAGIMTKVGVYAFIRLFTLIFPLTAFNQNLLLWIAGLSMLVGVFGAMARFKIKSILAFHSISQIGFMMMGLAIMTPLSLLGTLFYMVHHGLVKSNLFLISGIIKRFTDTDDLKSIGGLYKYMPGFAYLFLFSAFALAGFPPLTGFWGKLILFKASLATEVSNYAITAAALITGILTTLSMLKIWNYAFWSPRKPGQRLILRLTVAEKMSLFSPVILTSLIIFYIGINAEALLVFLEQAVAQLLNPQIYTSKVLP